MAGITLIWILFFLAFLESAYALHLSVEYMQQDAFARRLIYEKLECFLEIELTIEALMTTLEWVAYVLSMIRTVSSVWLKI